METRDELYTYLKGDGYDGALEDMLQAYYNTQNSTENIPLVDSANTYFVSLGYYGSLADMISDNDSFLGDEF